MTAPAHRPPPYDDLYRHLQALPPNKVGEIVDGRLWVSPRPAMPHAVGASVLGGLLVPRFYLGHGGPGGWVVLFEPELHLGAQVMVPDLAGWYQADLPLHELKATAASTAPAWICEVLSPATARLDRSWKLRAYGEAGVRYAWLLDPVAGTLEVFLRQGDRWVLERVHTPDDGSVCAAPFAEASLDLSPIWGPPAKPPVPPSAEQEPLVQQPPEQG
ncbi:MAG: Uma2 family endonuclease [Myxococcales bacterium]|nr:Uma2 family endonuclease [Myxococcales bacterium]